MSPLSWSSLCSWWPHAFHPGMGPVLLKSYSNSLFFKQHSKKALYDEFPLKLLMVMCLQPSRTPVRKRSYLIGTKSEHYSCDHKHFLDTQVKLQQRWMGVKTQEPHYKYITSLNRKSKWQENKSCPILRRLNQREVEFEELKERSEDGSNGKIWVMQREDKGRGKRRGEEGKKGERWTLIRYLLGKLEVSSINTKR